MTIKPIWIVVAAVGGFVAWRALAGGFNGAPPYFASGNGPLVPPPRQGGTATQANFLDTLGSSLGSLLGSALAGSSKVPTGRGGMAPSGGTTTHSDPDALIAPSWA